MAKYKYANRANTAVNDMENGIFGIHRGVHRWEEVQAWVNEGNTIEEFETPAEEADRLAREAQVAADVQAVAEAKAYTKLQAIAAMTPAQVRTWVDNNVNTMADAKDAIKTLAVAVCVLSRRL